jgi:hypothetical protein
MVKKGRSPHDGFYKIGSCSEKVEKPVLRTLLMKTVRSGFFARTVKRAFVNASRYGLRVRKSEMTGGGNGILHMGTTLLPRQTLVAVYPGKVCVAEELSVNDEHSDYVMGMPDYKHQGQRFDLVLVGKRSRRAWDCNNVNHSCKPNCEFVRYFVKGGVEIVGLVTTRGIKPGEELTADYGDDYFRPLKKLRKDLKAKARPRTEVRITPCGCGHCPYPRGHVWAV